MHYSWLILSLEIWYRVVLCSTVARRQLYERFSNWRLDAIDEAFSSAGRATTTPVYGRIDEFKEWGSTPLSELQPSGYFTDRIDPFTVVEESMHWMLLINTTRPKQPAESLPFDINAHIARISDSNGSKDDDSSTASQSFSQMSTSSGDSSLKSVEDEASVTEDIALAAGTADKASDPVSNSCQLTLSEHASKPQEDKVKIIRNKIVPSDPARALWFVQCKTPTCSTAALTQESSRVRFSWTSICSPFVIKQTVYALTSMNRKMGCRISSDRIFILDGYGSGYSRQASVHKTWRHFPIDETTLVTAQFKDLFPLQSDGLVVILDQNRRVLIKSFGRPPVGAVLFRKFQEEFLPIATSVDNSLVTRTVMSGDIVLVTHIAVLNHTIPGGFEAMSPVITAKLAEIMASSSGYATEFCVVAEVAIDG
ncbi:hypothetical protein PSACC_00220 [Paramicrosporidium saccamoebae]|uniref:Uncharacterized protein n=1 Tax=Paramicrosporidium saccamoebae TaxID=1246581 RepID=A0A2H9TNZ3_9FUNG|nr:hypothetical protein PSACC_00704 [Paramicrosporidium saccamoebae]PJF19961.1 hypothetical protein PSACC_00220 [Paramicrosporidium saccamoebae]